MMGDGRLSLFSRNKSRRSDRHNFSFTAALFNSIKSIKAERGGLGVSATKERFHLYFKLVPNVFTGYLTVSPVSLSELLCGAADGC